MAFIPIQDALNKGKGNVSVRGWIYRERGSNKLRFIVLRDYSNILQCVCKKEDFTDNDWKLLDSLTVESSIELHGSLHKDERAPTGYELRVNTFNLVHKAEKYPITQDQSTEFLADMRHLWIRSRTLSAVLKIRSTVFGAIHEYFRDNKYYEYHSPSLTPGVAEEGPTLFEVNYFGKKLYLTQTWQLYAEAGIFALEKIYTIAPSFRAEKSKTSRHLTEYWHAEVEAAWMNLDELLDVGEGVVKHVVSAVLKQHTEDLLILKRDTKKLEATITKPFPRITYDHALKLLKDKKKMNVKWGKDLRTKEEEKLMELYDTPVMVTHYPKDAMAFYKPKDPKNPKVALCFDMLAPEGYGELIGGSERDVDLKELEKAIKKNGENMETYKWYLDLRRYGSVPHAGFGMGVERLINWICGLDHIRDAIAFPRTMLRYTP